MEAAGSVSGVSGRAGIEHDAADGHRTGTDHVIRQARVSLDAPAAGGTVRADAGYAARDFGASEFYAPFDSYEETRTATASVAWRSRPARVVVEPRVSFRRHADDFILQRADPSFYHNIHTTTEADAELVARWRARPQLALAAGGTANRSSIESNSLGDRSENRIAGFAEAALGNVASGLLTLGVRLDHHSAFGAFIASSAAAGYRVSPGFRVRASAANGFRAPSWTDRYYEDPANIGTPDLDAERFWTAELGTELSAGPPSLDMAAFVRHADDLIDWGRPADEADTALAHTQCGGSRVPRRRGDCPHDSARGGAHRPGSAAVIRCAAERWLRVEIRAPAAHALGKSRARGSGDTLRHVRTARCRRPACGR